MTPEEAFLEAILDDPDADDVRLIFADWLEERGDPRGEFIRVQCELAKHSPKELDFADSSPARFPSPESKAEWLRLRRLIDREEKLLSGHMAQWAGDVLRIVPDGDIIRDYLAFRRGFVDEIRLSTDAFLKHAAELFSKAPITKVVLTDIQANRAVHEGEQCWGLLGIPHCFWKTFVDINQGPVIFRTKEQAEHCVSRMAVCWGRAEANLPTLVLTNNSSVSS